MFRLMLSLFFYYLCSLIHTLLQDISSKRQEILSITSKMAEKVYLRLEILLFFKESPCVDDVADKKPWWVNSAKSSS